MPCVQNFDDSKEKVLHPLLGESVFKCSRMNGMKSHCPPTNGNRKGCKNETENYREIKLSPRSK